MRSQPELVGAIVLCDADTSGMSGEVGRIAIASLGNYDEGWYCSWESLVCGLRDFKLTLTPDICGMLFLQIVRAISWVWPVPFVCNATIVVSEHLGSESENDISFEGTVEEWLESDSIRFLLRRGARVVTPNSIEPVLEFPAASIRLSKKRQYGEWTVIELPQADSSVSAMLALIKALQACGVRVITVKPGSLMDVDALSREALLALLLQSKLSQG